MLPYILFLITILLLTYLYNASDKVGNQESKLITYFSLVILFVSFSTFRSYSIGTDTKNYVFIYENLYEYYLSKTGIFNEFGFTLLQVIAKNSFDSYRTVMFFISFVISTIYLNTIFAYSKTRIFSVLLLLTLTIYFFHFNIARQAVAIAIFFWSVRYILHEQKWKFICGIFLGMLFHKSILFCLPAYYISRLKVTLINYLALFIAIFSIFYLVNTSIQFISTGTEDRYLDYAKEIDQPLGLFQFLFYFILVAFNFIYKGEIDSDKFGRTYINLVFVGLCISFSSVALSLDPNGLGRVSLYFYQFLLFSLPLAFYQINNIVIRSFLIVFFMVGIIAYFISNIITLSDLYPYSILGSLK